MTEFFATSAHARAVLLSTAWRISVGHVIHDSQAERMDATLRKIRDLTVFSRTGFMPDGSGEIGDADLSGLYFHHQADTRALAIHAVLSLLPDLDITSLSELDVARRRAGMVIGRPAYRLHHDPWESLSANAPESLPEGVADLDARRVRKN